MEGAFIHQVFSLFKYILDTVLHQLYPSQGIASHYPSPNMFPAIYKWACSGRLQPTYNSQLLSWTKVAFVLLFCPCTFLNYRKVCPTTAAYFNTDYSLALKSSVDSIAFSCLLLHLTGSLEKLPLRCGKAVRWEESRLAEREPSLACVSKNVFFSDLKGTPNKCWLQLAAPKWNPIPPFCSTAF